jgi:hypothetical protein
MVFAWLHGNTFIQADALSRTALACETPLGPIAAMPRELMKGMNSKRI